MPVADSLYFVYDGKKSYHMGIENVSVQTGLAEEPFLPEVEIKEIFIRGRDTPYFIEKIKRPLVLNLNFAFKNKFDENSIREVARWLNQSYYKELYFSDNINRRYYAMYTGDPRLLHNYLKQGYVSIQMRNIDCYTRSPVYTLIKDFSSVSSATFEIFNYGDEPCFPMIEIFKVGAGDLSIFNRSNGNIEFKFSGLADKENLTVDCENEIIETDIPLTYRYSNFNGNYLELLRGRNILHVVGSCKLKFTYEFKTLQG